MPKISGLPELQTIAGDDEIAIVDTSESTTKKVTASALFGINTGWVSAGETWTYSSYSATTRIAQITVATNAELRYTAGNRVRFEQPTDGVKFGIIAMVESTTLHIFMHEDFDVDNEAISEPYYSLMKSPLGFDLDPEKWQVVLSDAVDRTMSATPAGGTWYNDANLTIDIGVGAWAIQIVAIVLHDRSAGGTGANAAVTLSTTTNSETNPEFTFTALQRFVAATTTEQYKPSQFMNLTGNLKQTAPDTWHLLAFAGQSGTDLRIMGASYFHPTEVKATCAYL